MCQSVNEIKVAHVTRIILTIAGYYLACQLNCMSPEVAPSSPSQNSISPSKETKHQQD